MIKILGHYFHRRTLIQICFDLGLVVIAVMVTALPQVAQPADLLPTALSQALVLGLFILLINSGLGFYQRVHNRSVSQIHVRAVLGFFLSIPVAYLVWHLSQLEGDSARALLFGLVAVPILMLAYRIFVTNTTLRENMRHRVLVLGSGRAAKLVGNSLIKHDPNVDVVGYFARTSEEEEVNVSDWGMLTPTRSLTDIVKEMKVDEVVVAVLERRGGRLPLRELLDCKLQGVRVVDVATHFENTLGQIRLDSLSAGWLIFGEGFGRGVVRTVVKRLFDIVCSAILIIVTLPLMVVTSALIVLESRGPVLYYQERVGLNERLFNVVKFRSMRTDAELDGTPRWASATDDRVTRVGRIIRKLRIDELPQLFCVLSGSMSLVGPRPERPFFVGKLTGSIPFFAVRHSVKPGVTGWAQVRYQYGASVEDAAEKLQYDLYYVKNHSLFLDIIILFETVGVVVMGKGAH